MSVRACCSTTDAVARNVHALSLETAAGDLQLDEPTRAAALDLAGAVRATGLAVGWLSFEAPAVPEALRDCAAAGALRSVQVGANGSLSWKPRSGKPVLGDLLREHCAGCRVVFVEGRTTETSLRFVSAGLWSLRSGDRSLELDGEELVARLRRPRLSKA